MNANIALFLLDDRIDNYLVTQGDIISVLCSPLPPCGQRNNNVKINAALKFQYASYGNLVFWPSLIG